MMIGANTKSRCGSLRRENSERLTTDRRDGVASLRLSFAAIPMPSGSTWCGPWAPLTLPGPKLRTVYEPRSMSSRLSNDATPDDVIDIALQGGREDGEDLAASLGPAIDHGLGGALAGAGRVMVDRDP